MRVDLTEQAAAVPRRRRRWALSLLINDRLALAAACFLSLLALVAIVGPFLLGDLATHISLGRRNLPPFTLDAGWSYFLGGDNLGRSLIARIVAGAQTTLAVAVSAILSGIVIGGLLGLIAGYVGGWLDHLIMRVADVIISFPALLLALLVLFMLGPSVPNLIVVLAITRCPLYIRVTRAEALEIRERMFVRSAELMGASSAHIIWRHVLPIVLPTLITIGSVDFAAVVLIESSLSFLGLGIQPPAFTWGAMVAAGRNTLAVAWWVSFWPGLMILLTTISLSLLSNWVRLVNDPRRRSQMAGAKIER